MVKTVIEGWSVLEVDMNANLKTFTVKRRLERAELGKPGLQPTFIFYTSHGAQLLVNDKGTFLLRWKYPKKKDDATIKQMMREGLTTPKLFKPPDNLKRLAKKAMRQLFASGKVTK